MGIRSEAAVLPGLRRRSRPAGRRLLACWRRGSPCKLLLPEEPGVSSLTGPQEHQLLFLVLTNIVLLSPPLNLVCGLVAVQGVEALVW